VKSVRKAVHAGVVPDGTTTRTMKMGGFPLKACGNDTLDPLLSFPRKRQSILLSVYFLEVSSSVWRHLTDNENI